MRSRSICEPAGTAPPKGNPSLSAAVRQRLTALQFALAAPLASAARRLLAATKVLDAFCIVGGRQLLMTPKHVPHKLHNQVSEENGKGPFEPLGQAVHHDGVSRQNSEQVLEASALDCMVGREQRDQRSGDIADEVAECGIDTKPLELAETEGAPNKCVHSLAP